MIDTPRLRTGIALRIWPGTARGCKRSGANRRQTGQVLQTLLKRQQTAGARFKTMESSIDEAFAHARLVLRATSLTMSMSTRALEEVGWYECVANVSTYRSLDMQVV
jgi:hypothetical protein